MRPAADIRYYPDYEMFVYTEIMSEFSYLLNMAIINDPDGCTLPGELGYVKVEAYHSNKKPYFNAHSDGKVFKIFWFSKVFKKGKENERPVKAFRFCDIYMLKTAAPLRRFLTQFLAKTGGVIYHMNKARQKGLDEAVISMKVNLSPEQEKYIKYKKYGYKRRNVKVSERG